MNEKKTERKLVKTVKESGGMAVKLVCPGCDGMPDRLVLLPKGRIGFVELKSPGEKMRPLQVRRKEQLERLGFKVFCVDDENEIGGVIDEIRGA